MPVAALLAAAPAAAGGMNPAWLTALVALAVAVATCLGWGMRWAWRILRRAAHFLDDYFGEPAHDGLPAKPGVMARLSSVEELVAKVAAETTPNGGGSMRDEVARTARDVADIKQEQVAVRTRLELLQARQPRHGEAPVRLKVTPARAVVALLVLTLITGAGNLWASWTEVHASQAAIQAAYVREQKSQQRAGVILGEKLCTTFGKLAANKPPAGNPRTNPSRAYDQDEHAILDELGTDLGCGQTRLRARQRR